MVDNTWAKAYSRKAEVLLKLKEPEKADAELQRGLTVHPKDEVMTKLLGQANDMSFRKNHHFLNVSLFHAR